jgi:hypothetical protein
MNRIKKLEAIADIAYYAGYIKFTTGDSRADINLFIYWAKKFEKINENTNWHERDYITEIEAFAEKEILSL